ncbi:hypothetical protein [Actinomadura sp. NPDC048394]|uniref:hypothetical protein n=1 Tax=Actinomadura sp. NPDC048394 TaxID=3158223 RepID=UPI0033DC6E57
MTQDRESAGAVPGLDHPYDEEHLEQEVLPRVREVMGNDWPRRAKLGELASSLTPGELLDLVMLLDAQRTTQRTTGRAS